MSTRDVSERGSFRQPVDDLRPGCERERPVSFQGRLLQPRWVTVDNATLTAVSLDDESVTFTGAVYGPNGALVVESLRPAALGHWVPVDPVAMRPRTLPQSATIIDEAIYGGHFFMQWGHFLYETFNTAAVADRLPKCPVIYSPFAANKNAPRLEDRWTKCAPLLSSAWDDRGLVLQRDAQRFRRLHVPERLTVFGAPHKAMAAAAEMSEVYARVRGRFVRDGPNRVVARRPRGHVRLHPSEEEFYEQLLLVGFRILDVVNMAPTDQVAAFSAAEVIVGFSGSNLHNSVFGVPGATVIEIGDVRSSQRADQRNRTQVALCQLLHQRHVYIESFVEHEPVSAKGLVQRVCAEADRHRNSE